MSLKVHSVILEDVFIISHVEDVAQSIRGWSTLYLVLEIAED